jgi:hypothetical protein
MTMAQVRNIPSSELPSDLAAIYERFVGAYDGPRLAAQKYPKIPGQWPGR